MSMNEKDKRHHEYIKDRIGSIISDNELVSSTTSIGDSFTEYYIKELVDKEHNLDFEGILSGLDAQGANDCGIDFFYEDDNSFFIVQAKYCDDSSSIKSEDIARFGALYPQLFDSALAQVANRNIKDFLYNVRLGKKRKPIIMDFVYSKHFTESMKNEVTAAQNSVKRFWESNELPEAKINFISIKELREIHDRVHTGNQNDRGAIVLPLEKYENFFDHDELGRKSFAAIDFTEIVKSEHKTVVMPINGNKLVQLYKENGKMSLFSENIRFYQGLNKVNKDIMITIEDSPEDFFIFNNGISCICSRYDFRKRHKSIEIHNLQIINGAQTTATLVEAANNGKDLSKVFVLMKLTTSISDESKRKLIKANNSQTSVKDSDFRSNDIIQNFLGEKLSTYTYYGNDKGKKFKYLNKRQVRLRDRVCFTLDDLAKIKGCVDIGPTINGAGSKLFNTDENGLYYKIFGKDNAEIKEYNKNELDRIIATLNVFFRIEELRKDVIKSKFPPRSEKREGNDYYAHLARYHITWAIFYYINKNYSSSESKIIESISDGKIFKNKKINFIDDWFPEIVLIIHQVLDENEGIAWRNWQRNEKVSTQPLIKKLDTTSERVLPLDDSLKST